MSDSRVDLLSMSAIYTSSSILRPKLETRDDYLVDVRKMVTLCRERAGVFIPPTWLTQAQAEELGRRMGLPSAPA